MARVVCSPGWRGKASWQAACYVQELELLEKRGQSLKTKAETQAKYGW